MNNTIIVQVIIIFLGVIAVLALLRYLCLRYCPGDLNDLLHDALFDNDMWRNQNVGDQMSLQERRVLILASIVQKKAIKSERNGEIQLPHEVDLGRNQSEEIALEIGPSSSARGEIATLGKGKQYKDNIFVESVRKWRLSSRANNDDESVSSTIYSPKSCAICMTKYKCGDDICWSRNENCVHAFHLKCMMTWLMKHDDCPLCRCNFLKEDKSRDDHDGSPPLGESP
mmetsp:Transcript_4750/g.9074  ORF Transcript_4750/g.9074 Transcript_4750/m.9074 type:complete len:227 (-) Transcript_4750:2462-3142(-)